METCWRENSDERPTFDDLCVTLGQLLEIASDLSYRYFVHDDVLLTN
jgi:hypothetical protein